MVMERIEPAFSPEWLRINGSVGSSNGAKQQSNRHSLRSENHSSTLPRRNNSSLKNGDSGSPSPRYAYAPPCSNRKPVTTNGSMMHEKNGYSGAYNSFGRNHHYRDCGAYHNGERSVQGGYRDPYPTAFEVSNYFTGRNDAYKRSQSMVVSGKNGEFCSQRKATDSRKEYNSNNAGAAVTGSIQKAVFGRRFPSIEAEERQVSPDISRVSSPRLSSPNSASSMIGLDGLASSMAEVRALTGSNSTVHSSVQQNTPAKLSTVPPSSIGGLSMAETLAQAPLRTRSAAPQISMETKRLEELAIKKSRQLIPVTPLMPKSSNVGKLHVLKPAQERNGISSLDKERSTNIGRVANNQCVDAPMPTVPVVTPNKPKRATIGTYGSLMEKRLTASQAKSRSDFFNLVRKNSSMNLSSSPTNLSHALSTISDSSSKSIIEGSTVVTAVANDLSCPDSLIGNGANKATNGDSCEESQTYSNNTETCTSPDEEERAFLCSLGWDESSQEEGLTQDEIDAFYKEYMPLPVTPSLKSSSGAWKLKLRVPLPSYLDSFNSSAELSSSYSDSDSDA
ncbi:hypothetical protein IFM89_009841 [Coptis chinensis]|uniref:Uncharacterized protein n=1 Tax=Coptis chinensis TaxID=261450 RepID=A0A835HYH9_9MAGN|nr:hypothetical protein IFM89_009841 [Coptis chinensis]